MLSRGRGAAASAMEILGCFWMFPGPLLQSKEHAFQGRMCSEFARLRRVQADLEQETGHTCFLGRSVVQTGGSQRSSVEGE